MPDDGLRRLLQRPGLKLGTMVMEFNTPGIGQILAAAGCEYTFIDLEHSGFSIAELKQLLRYMQAADLPAVVRPPSKATHHIATALDAGAQGLMLPMVGSAEEAEAIVRAMKYVPEGSRGVALGVTHDRYRPGPVMQKLADANATTCCICLIETADGVANVEAIAHTAGVDALWLGQFDLSCSLGIPGEFEHPEFLAAVERIAAAARSAGKSLGRMVASVQEGVAYHKAGYDLICYQGDIWLIQEALRSGLEGLRKSAGGT